MGIKQNIILRIYSKILNAITQNEPRLEEIQSLKMMSYQDQVSGIAAELEEILDLDDLEAKVYLNLLRAGPITASALAKELDIDRARMYRTVDKLVSRNIISTTLSKSKIMYCS